MGPQLLQNVIVQLLYRCHFLKGYNGRSTNSSSAQSIFDWPLFHLL